MINAIEIDVILLSLKVAAVASIIALPISFFIGYFMARKDFIGKSIVESVIALPLVMPPVTTGYLLLILFGSSGVIGGWLYDRFGMRISFTFWAAVLASVVVSLPLVVRSIRTSIEMMDQGLEDTSRILGVGKWKTIWKVTVPLSLPGIIAGWVLGFARSLGEFGATITFAGNIEGETRTLPLAIYTLMQSPGKEESTWRLVVFSIVISLIAMMVSEWYLRKKRYDRS